MKKRKIKFGHGGVLVELVGSEVLLYELCEPKPINTRVIDPSQEDYQRVTVLRFPTMTKARTVFLALVS